MFKIYRSTRKFLILEGPFKMENCTSLQLETAIVKHKTITPTKANSKKKLITQDDETTQTPPHSPFHKETESVSELLSDDETSHIEESESETPSENTSSKQSNNIKENDTATTEVYHEDEDNEVSHEDEDNSFDEVKSHESEEYIPGSSTSDDEENPMKKQSKTQVGKLAKVVLEKNFKRLDKTALKVKKKSTIRAKAKTTPQKRKLPSLKKKISPKSIIRTRGQKRKESDESVLSPIRTRKMRQLLLLPTEKRRKMLTKFPEKSPPRRGRKRL